MQIRSLWAIAWAVGALAVLPVAGTSAASAADPVKPAIHAGFALGPGWAAPDGGAARTRGGAGAVFLGRDWTGPWAWGVDSRFWWHSRDSVRTELTFAGPALVWHPRSTGPLLRVAVGAAYEHRMLEFAQTSTDLRSDGAGVAVSAAYEFRIGTFAALGPQADYTRMWLGQGSAASFWSALFEMTFYFPVPPPADR